ncbi:MAG: hypothetical protein DRH37_04115 [Deltaproteobacteria bacterium]|nr:MAG: hypothetical protein DRH37_04115 [Deltaproteobacteria bacterium]
MFNGKSRVPIHPPFENWWYSRHTKDKYEVLNMKINEITIKSKDGYNVHLEDTGDNRVRAYTNNGMSFEEEGIFETFNEAIDYFKR